MTRKRRRILESPSGQGEVYEGENRIAKVNYVLSVEQEYLVIESMSNSDEVPGLKDISGQITVIDGDKNLIGRNRLTLYLNDGRKWVFITFSGSPVSGTYQVRNASGEGLTF